MNPLATTSGTLAAARDYLTTWGWRQDRNNVMGFATGPTGTDIHDAIIRCKGAKRLEAINALAAAAGVTDRIKSIGLVTWNNERGRTRDQVFALFEKAIEATGGAKT